MKWFVTQQETDAGVQEGSWKTLIFKFHVEKQNLAKKKKKKKARETSCFKKLHLCDFIINLPSKKQYQKQEPDSENIDWITSFSESHLTWGPNF